VAAAGAIITPEQVADSVVSGLAAETFLILPPSGGGDVLVAAGRGPGSLAGRRPADGGSNDVTMRSRAATSAGGSAASWAGGASRI